MLLWVLVTCSHARIDNQPFMVEFEWAELARHSRSFPAEITIIVWIHNDGEKYLSSIRGWNRCGHGGGWQKRQKYCTYLQVMQFLNELRM